MYSKPYLQLTTLPCLLVIQARLKWLLEIEKTSECNEKSSLPTKKPGSPTYFSAMGVPGDTRECLALKFEMRNPKHETNSKSEFSNIQNANI
jgi:hypothetical protein